MSSKINQILTNIVSTLQGINGTPTYTNTIQNAFNADSFQVEAVNRSLGEIPEDQFPHFSVTVREEQRTKEPSFLKCLAIFDIFVAFQNQTQQQVADWIADLEIALAQDIRRGTNSFVHDSWVAGIFWDDGSHRDGLTNQTFRIVKVEVQSTYTFPFGNPA